MKFNKTRLLGALITFNVNFSVGSFLIGLFEENNKGYIAGTIFLIAFILFCLKKESNMGWKIIIGIAIGMVCLALYMNFKPSKK